MALTPGDTHLNQHLLGSPNLPASVETHCCPLLPPVRRLHSLQQQAAWEGGHSSLGEKNPEGTYCDLTKSVTHRLDI